jgi:3-deoxy-manno-octulosonate cytidylyltransferase (CMP-KDO synthetase)
LKTIAMIPARYAATRFPGKLMKDLAGKPVIVRTYEAARGTGLFDEVIVVTDSEIIAEAVQREGGRVVMSQQVHETGSDRLAEAVVDMDADIVVNVQGDEPFTEGESLEKLIRVFHEDPEKEIDLASLMTEIMEPEQIADPNTVKVITDKEGFALYFSRAPIPYQRAEEPRAVYFKHKGVYAFRKRALLDFRRLPMLPLEAVEKIEAIRFLEYGKKIKMVQTRISGIEIDTPEDLERAKAAWT